MPTDSERWNDLLAAYEQHLGQQEAFLAAATAPAESDTPAADLSPPSAFVVPHGFPAAPANLRDRIVELHDRTTALELQSVDALAHLERPRRRRSAPAATVASVLDRSI